MLEGEEFRVETFASASEAVAAAQAPRKRCDLFITTLVMKEMDGFEVIRRLRGAGMTAPILLVTGHGTANTSVEAIRLGASDYLAKPVEREELRARVWRALGEREGGSFKTQDRAVLALLREVRKVADADARVLITGETGTGKELIARMLHQQGGAANGPFVAVNCAALPQELIESELFGHEAGAFTGAQRRRVGRFEEAAGGTLFLDEIGELGVAMQSKLLRVLQGGDFQRVGGNAALQLKARVVTATNRDLRHEVREGRFREDLYFRLNVVPLRIPPLRERVGDIRLLADLFARRYARKGGRVRFTPAALAVMERYGWPGNVRELEHLVERFSVLNEGMAVTVEHLPELLERGGAASAPEGEEAEAALPYGEALLAFQRGYFGRIISEAGGNMAEGARLAGLDRAQFFRMAVRLGVYRRQG